jgi:hypothetical protein
MSYSYSRTAGASWNVGDPCVVQDGKDRPDGKVLSVGKVFIKVQVGNETIEFDRREGDSEGERLSERKRAGSWSSRTLTTKKRGDQERAELNALTLINQIKSDGLFKPGVADKLHAQLTEALEALEAFRRLI